MKKKVAELFFQGIPVMIEVYLGILGLGDREVVVGTKFFFSPFDKIVTN